MRWLPFTLLLAAAPVAADGYTVHVSDPAFLGIAMPAASAGGCPVEAVTPDTPAQLAGLKAGDVVVGLDRKPIASCDELTQIVTGHASGDALAIQLLGGRALSATLSTRADVMRRRVIGHALALEVDAIQTVSDKVSRYTPTSLDHRAIVGWFEPGCGSECAAVFAKVDRWNHAHGGKLALYGATFKQGFYTASHDAVSPEELAHQNANDFATSHPIGIPLLRTSSPTVMDAGRYIDLKSPIVFEPQRIIFTVVDDNGDVSYLAPVAPQGDDVDAALEELFVAASTHSYVAPARR